MGLKGRYRSTKAQEVPTAQIAKERRQGCRSSCPWNAPEGEGFHQQQGPIEKPPPAPNTDSSRSLVMPSLQMRRNLFHLPDNAQL